MCKLDAISDDERAAPSITVPKLIPVWEYTAGILVWGVFAVEASGAMKSLNRYGTCVVAPLTVTFGNPSARYPPPFSYASLATGSGASSTPFATFNRKYVG